MRLAQAGNADAEAELRCAVDLAPNDPGYLTDLGTVLAMQEKLEESTRFCAKTVKRDPSDLTARRYLAASRSRARWGQVDTPFAANTRLSGFGEGQQASRQQQSHRNLLSANRRLVAVA